MAIVLAVSGCTGLVADGGEPGSAEPTATSSPTETEQLDNRTCSTGEPGASNATATPTADPDDDTPTGNDVTVAPVSTRVQVGNTDRVNYRGRNVSLSYTRSDGTSRIVVEMGDHREVVTRSVTDSADTVSWSWANLRFVVRPVEAEQRNGQTVYVFGENWNTTHVELDVFCTEDC